MTEEIKEIAIRRININDYEEIISLWRKCGLKIEIDGADSFNSIKKSLELMPQLHIVAEDKGLIVGVIIGSYDYRKGYIHRLAIKKEYRRRGIAKKLMNYAEAELIKLGAKRIDGLIFKENSISKSLLKKMGYEPAHNVTYFTKSIVRHKWR